MVLPRAERSLAGGSSIYLSKNLGGSWTVVDRSGLPLSFVSSLAVCGDYIFALLIHRTARFGAGHCPK